MTEPIRHRSGDNSRERQVAEYLEFALNWKCYPTPKFYFVDYLVNQEKPGGYANYIGSLEIKWMNRPADSIVKFPYQKLLQIWNTEPLSDDPQAFNRICIRYTDSILLIPAKALRGHKPIYGITRSDTNEHDFNIHFNASEEFPNYLKPIVLN